ncbi:ammonia-dependent NAD(+) synthetase [Texcoconibacillus texcoconensis]|uniref:NH(3)-dependent NAD(+) synthetase n=1 Tax=Texcoconibacillus texcoconensis TaxID=1095777 RepID=A0A840QT33_9BACI|nr:ammonia-dependent NAD(+) synthetase [Texcoconibacillus texcoconensis]MBB5174473.1 NAD+ synthase [Texcoconibacillus texcoconensis]
MTTQSDIIQTLQVQSTIDVNHEIRKRIDFLKSYVKHTGLNGFVLGISGGQDSTLAGKLVQLAVDELNEENSKTYTFIAMRLPYGVQLDEDDAQDCLDYISPEQRVTVNIKPAVDASYEQFSKATNETMSDFVKGNTKARERMKAQYDVAAHYNCLVVGTDHAAEAVTGFYTKFGDGACDIAPLFGLNKRQGKLLLKVLGCPEPMYQKVPTADLEDDQPLLPDEEALGFTYDQIDDFLEGKSIAEDVAEKLTKRYKMCEHKRQMPVTVYDHWWK